MPTKSKTQGRAPDEALLTGIQVKRLSSLARVPAKQVEGRSLVELRDVLKWRVEPYILGSRRVCGRVVRTNPLTGRDEPVPYATVYVEDVDTSLFGYFPKSSPYGWWHPFRTRREVVATATTDECGRFCVWVPRLDIDWVVRWRLRRKCGVVFAKPTVADLIERAERTFEVDRPFPVPEPGPDPVRLLKSGVDTLRALAASVGTVNARRIDEAARATEAGDEPALHEPAFRTPLPPPSPRSLDVDLDAHVKSLRADLGDEVAAAEPLRWYGPFLRCEWVLDREVMPMFDVPDIAFRVEQTIDGTPTVIYSEGLFDVRWNAGDIPDVTLHAAPFAVSTPSCGVPDMGPCAEPGLYMVGSLPLRNETGPGTFPYVDVTTGYAVRPNRPHPSGDAAEVPPASLASTSPVTRSLVFRGCVDHEVDGVMPNRYRILDSVRDPASGVDGPAEPVRVSWPDYRFVGGGIETVARVPDADGWYETPSAIEARVGGELGVGALLQWHGAASARHTLTLQLGRAEGGTTTLLHSADPLPLQVDDTAPVVSVPEMRWSRDGGTTWHVLPNNCPTIRRHPGETIRVAFDLRVSARHLRSVHASFRGCGSGHPTLVDGLGVPVPPGGNDQDYWHRHAGDNALVATLSYDVPPALPSGAYSFAASAWTRAFAPEQNHHFWPTDPDVHYNPAINHFGQYIPIAIVDD
jgi:hypothetical protein